MERREIRKNLLKGVLNAEELDMLVEDAVLYKERGLVNIGDDLGKIVRVYTIMRKLVEEARE